jgi:hypothetical protein
MSALFDFLDTALGNVITFFEHLKFTQLVEFFEQLKLIIYHLDDRHIYY